MEKGDGGDDGERCQQVEKLFPSPDGEGSTALRDLGTLLTRDISGPFRTAEHHD